MIQQLSHDVELSLHMQKIHKSKIKYRLRPACVDFSALAVAIFFADALNPLYKALVNVFAYTGNPTTPLLNDKILTLSKLKAFADDKINVT